MAALSLLQHIPRKRGVRPVDSIPSPEDLFPHTFLPRIQKLSTFFPPCRPPLVQVRGNREKGGGAPRPAAPTWPRPSASRATRAPDTQRGKAPGALSRPLGSISYSACSPATLTPSRRRSKGPGWTFLPWVSAVPALSLPAAARGAGSYLERVWRVCCPVARGLRGDWRGWRARRTEGAPRSRCRPGGARHPPRRPGLPGPGTQDPWPGTRALSPAERPRSRAPAPAPGLLTGHLSSGCDLERGRGNREPRTDLGGRRGPAGAPRPQPYSQRQEKGREATGVLRQTKNETALQQIGWNQLCLFSLFLGWKGLVNMVPFKMTYPGRFGHSSVLRSSFPGGL
ncbi:hypothetical protein P7K49_015029 [Saguinus oedipus]|uniref:Uncharacterized protein n=1 Tax=Saguinus oedipus TaxID=9490 RepID=A0ABQ9V847_SAGOE|nr:hypothetical protein P7K49_015029 [Saguinus oedipus]